MHVKHFRRPNGWNANLRNVDDIDDLQYGVVKDRGREIAVLIRGRGDYRCSACKKEDCRHAKAIADRLEVAAV